MTTTHPETSALREFDNVAGLHVLVVEDYEDAAETTAVLLRMVGHEVQIARTGVEALEKARADNPDVVLLDLGLPGMSGYDVARRLSSHRPRKAPFLIALTGYGQEEDRRHCAEAGIDLHLLKPVDPSLLQGVLARFQRVIGS